MTRDERGSVGSLVGAPALPAGPPSGFRAEVAEAVR